MKLLDIVILGILILWAAIAAYAVCKHKGIFCGGGCRDCQKSCDKKKI